MAFLSNLRSVFIAGARFLVQIRAGYKPTSSFCLFSSEFHSLFFKVSPGSSAVSAIKSDITNKNRWYSKMTDSEERKAELKKRLTPLQYHVTQEKGTERAFTGVYNKHTDLGTYRCIVCDTTLFSSKTKFDSGCGWPAFNDVLDQGKIKLTKDTSNGMVRTEVTCSECGSHLGHVFNDGPPPTKKRFCINSASLTFQPAEGDSGESKQ